jgi:hypothetical protein
MSGTRPCQRPKAARRHGASPPLPPPDDAADLTDWLASHSYEPIFDAANMTTSLELAYYATADERFIVILGNVLHTYRVAAD